MAISLEHSEQASKIAALTTALIDEVVIPLEKRTAGRLHDGPADIRGELQDAAKAAGVFAPHVSPEWGGLGLDRRSQVPVFEAAGRSLLGPLALNIAAPDEGNMHLLEEVATADQKKLYLQPLATGATRSCFAMTEPSPGAGADPRQLNTTATAVDGGWRIDGRKWFITGAPGAAFTICMARTSGAAGDKGGATMFLVDSDNPGMEITATLDTLDESMFAGHGQVTFRDCFVTDEAVLEPSTRALTAHRFGWLRRGSLTVCAGWDWPPGPKRWQSAMSRTAPPSAASLLTWVWFNSTLRIRKSISQLPEHSSWQQQLSWMPVAARHNRPR